MYINCLNLSNELNLEKKSEAKIKFFLQYILLISIKDTASLALPSTAILVAREKNYFVYIILEK